MAVAGPHLVYDISPHGFGHLAQSAGVVAALRRRYPDLRLTLRCAHGAEVVSRFIPPPWDRADPPPELGMAMLGPNDVDVDRSLAYYRDLHRDWHGLVRQEGARLADLRPDLLVANAGHVGLAAAQARGIPAVAVSSLDWYDIARAYFPPEAAPLLEPMRAAYAGAAAFIRLDPALPMADFPNCRSAGPVARLGVDRRAALLAGRPRCRHIILVSFGGWPGQGPLQRVPMMEAVLWLVSDPALAAPGRPDILHADSLGLSFPDLVRSSDLVLTKPGYGMFVESVCNGTRLLSLERPDWPETAGMVAWAERHGVTEALPPAVLNTPALDLAITALLERPVPPPPHPTGGEDAAAIIAGLLRA
ncbi:hypothetical protein [Oleisolibacter albus]|uniref:hypothetical protein n=1 Tax=Oleisolibacter albus TaxID=2171757 RepID=UPI000DF1DE6A|nr:hypothetical protein [Oleisolibacter albus]